MRLFVSYARVDKPYCIQIVNTLDVHEIWYDQRLYAGQQWWKEILRRIDWCEGFIYLLSPESVTSQYCQRELEIALSHGRQIIPVVIHDETQIPDILAETQYVDLTTGLNGDTVRTLLNSIYIAEQNTAEAEFIPITTSSDQVNKPRASDARQMMTMAAVAMEENRYDQAVFLIKQAKTNGFKSRFINLDTMLREAEMALEQQMLQREAEREYRQILDLMQFASMRRHACEAFAAFQSVYPNYDPEGIAIQCDEYSAMHDNSRTRRSSESIHGEHEAEDDEGGGAAVVVVAPPDLKLLDFVAIPAGTINDNRSTPDRTATTNRKVTVPAFEISRYPITNEQYSEFVNHPYGYRNPDWWNYSKVAMAWYKQNRMPHPSSHIGKENPREMVTWFEAVAFTCWLSEMLEENVFLPHIAHWQRAVQCDDEERIFPWGNTYDFSCCNTRESRLKSSTSVREFPNGVSEAGVFDLAGNVWEWCAPEAADKSNETQKSKLPVVGGSFVSPLERAQVNFSYNLDPRTFYSSIGFRVIKHLR